jgi:hypothetical protein
MASARDEAYPYALGKGVADREVARILNEKNMGGLPIDPQEVSDYKNWLKAMGYKRSTITVCLQLIRKAYGSI